ncbi:hypothetical protein Pcinc_025431 [Petrolisthes cinctipes]|uniref:WAP domain-containing protein n=1 Tax=Petrolisthes cinctipes TaxID=88211 RepID=A0AAE1F980_PETCI|nr:hypothetical protein Pcinc_025431 [Petrolisthes cinctipes]
MQWSGGFAMVLGVTLMVSVTSLPQNNNQQGRFGGGSFLGGALGALQGGVNVGIPGVIPGAGLGGISAVSPGVNPPSSCRRWCRTPENSVYCCKNNFESEGNPFVVKQGVCPPVRLQCPNIRNFQPPGTCASDGDCSSLDKCCFDRCLEKHICKQPDGFGFGGFGR